MDNLVKSADLCVIFFDVKGSEYRRKAKPGEFVLKDTDLVEMGIKINVSQH